MNKSTYVCKQCSFNCQLQIHTWFVNPHIVCPKGIENFKWEEIPNRPLNKVVEDGQAELWHCERCGVPNPGWRENCGGCATPAT